MLSNIKAENKNPKRNSYKGAFTAAVDLKCK